ncbi:hypothetical protein F4V88_28825 [Neorhizobium galegae]|nr:hypothetical protein F4V88_28825 [Neorhizobium galegae]
MNGPSNTPANNPACSNPAADSVEFGTSADGFPVARIGEILLALLWQINPRLTMIGDLWHFNRGAKDGRAGCCTDGMAEAVR